MSLDPALAADHAAGLEDLPCTLADLRAAYADGINAARRDDCIAGAAGGYR